MEGTLVRMGWKGQGRMGWGEQRGQQGRGRKEAMGRMEWRGPWGGQGSQGSTTEG